MCVPFKLNTPDPDRVILRARNGLGTIGRGSDGIGFVGTITERFKMGLEGRAVPKTDSAGP